MKPKRVSFDIILMEKALYYFGCISEPGHSLWETQYRTTRPELLAVKYQCNPYLFRGMDATFPPGYAQHCGLYSVSVVPPFRIISWWDRSVDNRPGSHSTFIAYGYTTLKEIFDAMKEQYPKVMSRQPEPKPHDHQLAYRQAGDPPLMKA